MKPLKTVGRQYRDHRIIWYDVKINKRRETLWCDEYSNGYMNDDVLIEHYLHKNHLSFKHYDIKKSDAIVYHYILEIFHSIMLMTGETLYDLTAKNNQ